MKYLLLLLVFIFPRCMLAAPPSCYPGDANASAGFPTIEATAEGSCAIWACDTGDHRWHQSFICGTWSEIAALGIDTIRGWMFLTEGQKDDKWNTVFTEPVVPGSVDDRLIQVAKAVPLPTIVPPSGLVTIDTKVYTLNSSADFNVISPVGVIPLGIRCDANQSLTQSGVIYYVVPASAVTKWNGTKRLRVFAKCTSQ